VLARRSSRLPPGPSSRLLATARFARDPYGYFEACRARYGDPFTLPLLGTRVVVTGRPELVRSLYALPPTKVGGLLGHLIPEILGPSSVLVLSGEPHAVDRKLLMPMFHGERIAAYGRIIAEVTRTEAARHAPGARLSMYELGRAISLDVILRALFGVEEAGTVAALRRAVLRLAEAGAPPLIFFRALRRSIAGLGPWARVERRLAELDALLYAQIAERRARPAGVDLLSLLVAARYDDGSALSDAQIRDQLMSLILAGHETMAVTLAWAMHWILAERGVRARLDEELRGAEDVGRLPYLDAVCKETLRIYPIQPIVMRHLLEPMDFAGYEMPAGAFVGAATTLVHMDPAIYPEPEKFCPERFLAGGPGMAEFFPFGGGARRCIGAAFALYEMKVVLATLRREFPFHLVSTATPRPIRQSTVTGPSGGVELVRA
jgi:cytochrome P450